MELGKPIPTEEELLWEELKTVRESSDKVRKGIFARHNEICRTVIDLKEKLYLLEKHICERVK